MNYIKLIFNNLPVSSMVSVDASFFGEFGKDVGKVEGVVRLISVTFLVTIDSLLFSFMRLLVSFFSSFSLVVSSDSLIFFLLAPWGRLTEPLLRAKVESRYKVITESPESEVSNNHCKVLLRLLLHIISVMAFKIILTRC